MLLLYQYKQSDSANYVKEIDTKKLAVKSISNVTSESSYSYILKNINQYIPAKRLAIPFSSDP